MTTRTARLEQGQKKRDISGLRKKNQKIELVVNSSEEMGNAFSTLPIKNQVELSRRVKAEMRQKELKEDEDFFLPQSNRIYHQKSNSRHIQNIKGSNPSKGQRASLNNLCKHEFEDAQMPFQERPQSSQGNKIKMGSQIFKSKNDVLNFDNRPGSSKSSRLFKRKGPFASDAINCQNEEGQPLIRVTSIGGGRAGTSYLKGSNKSSMEAKGRVGTSLSRTQRAVQKIPSKIDPDFFRLFAQ